MDRRYYMVCGLVLIASATSPLHAAPPASVEVRPAKQLPEIEAECWFNAQPVRIHEAPKLILLEFWSVRSPDSREFIESLATVHEAYSDGRLLIVALTEDDCKDAEKFIRHKKIPYKVGAESKSGKDYGADDVKALPVVVLIDPRDGRVVERWSGRDVQGKAIVEAIQKHIGPPPGVAISSGSLAPAEREVFMARVTEADDQLQSITSEILGAEGPIGPEALAALDRFYEQHVPEHPDQDSAETRAANLARSTLFLDTDVGYGKLISSGRLSEAGKTAVRDRVLGIGAEDPSPQVRSAAAHGLRKFIGQRGDPVLLEALRRMLERESDPNARASIDHALEELAPGYSGAPPLSALKLSRMLNEAPEPTSSVWADAHAYRQTVSQRTTEQLLEDYRAYPDPPDDEIRRQNAVLKRYGALGEIGNRIVRGQIRDMGPVKDHMAKVLSEEPDPNVRKSAIMDLTRIAEHGGRGTRAEVVELFEKRLPEEKDRYVRAALESMLQELKPK